MLRGTRVLLGKEAAELTAMIDRLRGPMEVNGFQEIILPAIWEAQTFIDKAGPEIMRQMFFFADKGDRSCCLIPEVTGVIQELWNNGLCKTLPKPAKLFYVSRCYRYERPQAGRYREFTQFGVEILGEVDWLRDYAVSMLRQCLIVAGLNRDDFIIQQQVKRGLSYYVEDGFEAEVPGLGAQKQVAGGGRYAEGIGWAIGVERLILARKLTEDQS